MRKRLALLLGICTLLLVGCGNKDDAISDYFNSFIEKSVLDRSDIQEDDSYEQYTEIAKKNDISVEGYYTSEEVHDDVIEDPDAVHVTFAENSYMSVLYFDDLEMHNLLNPEGVTCVDLHANDCIYASVQEVNNPNTEAYQFSRFEVWEFDENGKKKELEVPPFEGGLVYQIPMMFSGKEISIIPLGEYTQRTIELHDYVKDTNGIDREMAGEWSVNGEQTNGGLISISPVASCVVSYKYDPEVYAFVGSDPVCLYNNEMDGVVSFEEYEPDKGIDAFSVELHKKDGDQQFDPNQYTIAHAEIKYQYQGVPIEGSIFIPDGSKISYEVSHIDEGYWVPGEMKGEVEIERLAEVIADLVCKEEKVKVFLPQPDRGGTISYMLDGRALDGSSVEALVGSEIVMSFIPKNGWSCDAKDNTVYKVVSKDVQTVNVEGRDVNEIFTEQQYKPIVSLTLDKSVKTLTEFSITTVDGTVSNLRLEDDKKNREVFKEEVGTKKDLTISASGGALLEGHALKVEIEKETKNGQTEKDICYLQKIPDSIIVPLYISNDSVIYETVKLTVSNVNVEVVKERTTLNGSVLVKTTDLANNRVLGKGDVIEPDRKVNLTISAEEGYYVKDSNENGTYSETMKYSKLNSDYLKIISAHSVKKLYKITFDVNDPYGIVTFKIDGKAVESEKTYDIKEEQKLEIIYEIKDGKYVVVHESDGLIENIGDFFQGKSKETKTIFISSALDGSTLTREMFIKVKEK